MGEPRDEQEREGARLLGALRGFEPPAGRAALPGLAVRAGRRRVRARRAAGAAAAAAAVLAAVVPVRLLGGPADPGPAAGAFPPGRPAFRVGSAGGFTLDSYETGPVQVIRLRPERPGGPPRADGLVEMYPRGVLPRGQEPAGPAAPAVHDRPARWLTVPLLRPGAVELAWEWRPGAWGVVSLQGPDADRRRAHLVALSVVPWDMPGMPGTAPPGTAPPAGAPSAAPSGATAPATGPATGRATGQARP
ncbi:hypothetical protein [Actinomadura macrotermitis]|uniref:Uncharacterized protein n=1 Tax=Actinomadura macrotermitis TaxID=2585200 RepID=A0A7K0C6T2_9ACTN|nr:hypothetical protein [Actinomadura macrotermitis]MQY09128.1 hypothetical protein [Actinomadura macrotermitis]